MLSKIKFLVIDSENSMFGLSVEKDGTNFKIYEAITSDKERIDDFCEKLNRSDISIVHIEDVIEDFLE